MDEERTEEMENKEENTDELKKRISELEETLKSRYDDVKILSDRVGELESDLKTRDEEYKTLVEEKEKIKRDFDTLKQNTTTQKTEVVDEVEETPDMGELLLQIKNIMN